MNPKLLHKLVIGVFVSLYIITSTISTIHSIDFFKIANSYVMSIFLAIAFEIGAAGSLAAIIVRDKMNMFLVWTIFVVLTLFQIMNNVYFSFMHLGDFSKWSEMFSLNEEDILTQKRIVSVVLGAVLPLIALGFIKALIDYISPNNKKEQSSNDDLMTIDDDIKKDDKTVIGDEITQTNKTDNIKNDITLTKSNSVEELINVNNIEQNETYTENENISNKEQTDNNEVITADVVDSFSSKFNGILDDDLGSIRKGSM